MDGSTAFIRHTRPPGTSGSGVQDAPASVVRYAMFDPLSRRLGNGIVGVKLDVMKQLQLADYFGAPNANWLWRRDLDVNTTPVALSVPTLRTVIV